VVQQKKGSPEGEIVKEVRMHFIYPIYQKEMWEFLDALIVAIYLNIAQTHIHHSRSKRN
jgi:hypothetical protein